MDLNGLDVHGLNDVKAACIIYARHANNLKIAAKKNNYRFKYLNERGMFTRYGGMNVYYLNRIVIYKKKKR